MDTNAVQDGGGSPQRGNGAARPARADGRVGFDGSAGPDEPAVPHGAAGPADYLRLAPSIEREWVEDFVLEQRLIGVPGDRIGDALALVESHVADSGEPVREAFGDARSYAREAAPAARVDADGDPTWLAGVGLSLGGMVVTGIAATEWLFGTGILEVTTGLLVTVALLLAGFIVLAVAPGAVLGLAVRRTGLSVAACILVVAAMVAALLVFDTVVGRWPAAVVAIAGLVMLAVGTALEWRTASRGGLDDPILGPDEPASTRRRGTTPFDWLTLALFPVLTVLMIGLGWLVSLGG